MPCPTSGLTVGFSLASTKSPEECFPEEGAWEGLKG